MLSVAINIIFPQKNSRQEMGELIFWILLVWKSLKRNGMGEINSCNHYIYYCRQESLRRNGLFFYSEKKSLKCSSFHFISVAQLCPTLCDPMNLSTPASLSITNSQSLPKLISIELERSLLK